MMLAEKIDWFSLLKPLRGTVKINWSAAFGTKKDLSVMGVDVVTQQTKFRSRLSYLRIYEKYSIL